VFETENGVCHYKAGSNNKRSYRGCLAQLGCSWNGGQCTLDIPVFDEFYMYIWYLQFKDSLDSFTKDHKAILAQGGYHTTEQYEDEAGGGQLFIILLLLGTGCFATARMYALKRMLGTIGYWLRFGTQALGTAVSQSNPRTRRIRSKGLAKGPS
jgi:hypothetical protein